MFYFIILYLLFFYFKANVFQLLRVSHCVSNRAAGIKSSTGWRTFTPSALPSVNEVNEFCRATLNFFSNSKGKCNDNESKNHSRNITAMVTTFWRDHCHPGAWSLLGTRLRRSKICSKTACDDGENVYAVSVYLNLFINFHYRIWPIWHFIQ